MAFRTSQNPPLRDAKILVTGANGFLGKQLCCQLEQQGASVVRLVRRLPKKAGQPNLFVSMDLTDGDLSALLGDLAPDAVIHCAGKTGEPRNFEQQMEQYAANFVATARLIEALKTQDKPARLILVSSAAIYAPMNKGQQAIAETHPWRPTSKYGVGKAAAAMLGQTFIERRELPVVIAVPFNIIGKGQPAKLVPQAFIDRLRENPDEITVGDLGAIRDWIDIRDVASALICLLEPSVPAGIYNIASGTGASVGSLLDDLCEILQIRPVIKTDFSAGNLHSVPVSIGDITKIKKFSNWYPKFSVKDSLSDMLRN